MQLVYIAGKYSGDDYLEIDVNIAKAREAAAWCARHGIGFFAPHLNSAHFEVVTPTVDPEFWYQLDLEFLQRCQAILLLDGWEESHGARHEAELADQIGMPRFIWDDGFPVAEGGDLWLAEWYRRDAVESGI